ncbi:MAG: hypothetical protein K9K81_03125 [Desulfobacteraceae bacterium]|nr:hypothetical protein [Desulfobacteraceae bacterium]
MNKFGRACWVLFFINVFVYPCHARGSGFEGNLVFLANFENNWDVVLWEGSDKPAKRLTKTPWDEKDPCLSPSGNRIAYTTTDGVLHIIDLESGKTNQLVFEKCPGKWESPSFSADGKKLVCSYFKPEAKDRAVLGVIDTESEKVEFIFDQYCPQFTPSRSPRKARLAYACTHCSSSCGKIIQEIWVADLSSGKSRQLAMTNAHCQEPAWSPDESEVAFCADISGNFDIWSADAKTGELTQITDHDAMDESPSFSPDGEKIAFISTRSGRSGIYLKALDTGNVNELKPFANNDIEYRELDWK